MLNEAVQLLEDAEEIISDEAERSTESIRLLAIADQIHQCKNELLDLIECK